MGENLGKHWYRLHSAMLHCFYSRQLIFRDFRTAPDLFCTPDGFFHASHEEYISSVRVCN